MFSKSCEYGIKAMVFITQKSIIEQRVRLNEIAQAIDSPTAFTAKILQKLSKEKIIHSIMGKAGGYEIKKNKLTKITLLDIVNIIDGEDIHKGCGLGFKKCNHSTPCPIHFDFIKIREDLKKMLSQTTIITLATKLDNGQVQLKEINFINK